MLCLMGLGLFPIINFNPENPVDFGTPARFALIALAAFSCAAFGKSTHALFPKWKLYHVALISFGIACFSLVLRFLLEFGEVSNTYNFTVINVLFHLLFVTLISTGSAFSHGDT